MRKEIITLKEIVSLIDEKIKIVTPKNKNKLEEIRNVFERRRQKIADEYYDVQKKELEYGDLTYDEISSINSRLKKRLFTERKGFRETFFELDNKLQHLKGYEKSVKDEGVNEFLHKLSDIRYKGNDDENIILYLVTEIASEKSVNKSIYSHIKKKSKGLNSTGFSDIVLGFYLEIEPLHQVVEELQLLKIINDKNIQIALEKNSIEMLNNFFYDFKTSLYEEEKILKFKTKNTTLAPEELDFIYKNIRSKYLKAEKSKNNFYFYLEFISITEPQKIEKIFSELKLKKIKF